MVGTARDQTRVDSGGNTQENRIPSALMDDWTAAFVLSKPREELTLVRVFGFIQSITEDAIPTGDVV